MRQNQVLGSCSINSSCSTILLTTIMGILYICFGRQNSKSLLRNACESSLISLTILLGKKMAISHHSTHKAREHLQMHISTKINAFTT